MLLKKTNAVLSLITILLLFIHTGYTAYCYLTFYYNPVLKIVFSLPLIVCTCLHAVLGMSAVFMNIEGTSGNFYPQFNRETLVQRISAALILPLLILHIKTFGFLSAAAEGSHTVLMFLIFVSEALFYFIVFTHIAVSTSRALITMGWLSSAETKKRIYKTMYIICTLFWIFASAAVIHGQIAMFAK